MSIISLEVIVIYRVHCIFNKVFATPTRSLFKDFHFNRESSFLNYLDIALQRIEDSSFGICLECDRLISKERLEEVPHATKCFDCKTSNK